MMVSLRSSSLFDYPGLVFDMRRGQLCVIGVRDGVVLQHVVSHPCRSSAMNTGEDRNSCAVCAGLVDWDEAPHVPCSGTTGRLQCELGLLSASAGRGWHTWRIERHEHHPGAGVDDRSVRGGSPELQVSARRAG